MCTIASSLVYYGNPECENEWVPGSCACPWGSFPSIRLLSPALVGWLFFNLIIFYFFTFGCYLRLILDAYSKTEMEWIMKEREGGGAWRSRLGEI